MTLGSGLRVVGTHLAHSTHGSPLHLRRLYSMLPSPGVPAVLGGDMNFWGPPLEAVLRGWRRSARGKTWPARRPRHQLDHLFVTRPVKVLGGGVVRAGDSDHLPLRAKLLLLTHSLAPGQVGLVTNREPGGSDCKRTPSSALKGAEAG